MSNLIDRQEAIDAVEHITSSMSVCVNTDECHGMKRMQRQAVLELANMPSAQPEQLGMNLAEVGTDCISRQAALDCFHDWIDKNGDVHTPDEMPEYRAIEELPSVQPDVPDKNVGNINKFIDGLEEIFADIREQHGDDSVCGLCEYDGAYMGQSGDWCNECPGFDKDDCFKLSDECRERWMRKLQLPSAQPEIIRCKDCLMHGICRFETGLGENGYCSQAERREE